MQPFELKPNIMERPYHGGPKLAEFRAMNGIGDYHPEDWVGSTTSMFMNDKLGQTVLDDGQRLRDAINKDPNSFLGPNHTLVYGSDPGLLVKLLDAGERLSVQCHPDRNFAEKHLNSKYGKAESWIILDTYVDDPVIYLGFQKAIELDELHQWIQAQDRDGLRNLLNRVEVTPGDRIFVPGGIPHAIGKGILMVEVQEPTDWLLRLEWKGYNIGSFPSDMGLGMERALQCVDRSAYDLDRLSKLCFDKEQKVPTAKDTEQIQTLLPSEANPYFRVERIRPQTSVALESGYSILIVTHGNGILRTDDGYELILQRGKTALVPWSAGQTELIGNLEVIRCRPPAPESAE